MKAIIARSLVLGAALVAAAIAPQMAAAEVFYIAPTGSDVWSGTLSEANTAKNDGPVATLERARQLVRARIAKGLKEPITVQIRGGEYSLDHTVIFGPDDSGTEKCPITYKACPGEKPVFTGAKRLTGWKPCTIDPEGLPAAAKGKLWSCEIPAELKILGESPRSTMD